MQRIQAGSETDAGHIQRRSTAKLRCGFAGIVAALAVRISAASLANRRNNTDISEDVFRQVDIINYYLKGSALNDPPYHDLYMYRLIVCQKYQFISALYRDDDIPRDSNAEIEKLKVQGSP